MTTKLRTLCFAIILATAVAGFAATAPVSSAPQAAGARPMPGPTRAAAEARTAAPAQPATAETAAAGSGDSRSNDTLLLPPAINVSFDWASRYVFQGLPLNDRPVGISVIEINKGEAYFGLRSAYDFTSSLKRHGYVDRHRHGAFDSNRKWRFQEHRFYVGDTMILANPFGLGATQFDLNWTYIQYPTVSENDTAEISLELALIEIGRFDRWRILPTLTLTHDYEIEKSWISAGALASVYLNERAKCNITADLYWGDSSQARFVTGGACDGNAFYSAVLGVSLDCCLTDEILLTPYINLTAYPDSRCRDAMRNHPMGQRTTVWGGVRISVAF